LKEEVVWGGEWEDDGDRMKNILMKKTIGQGLELRELSVYEGLTEVRGFKAQGIMGGGLESSGGGWESPDHVFGIFYAKQQ
jgi:hypothetical protein